jgi:hypothetical protein
MLRLDKAFNSFPTCLPFCPHSLPTSPLLTPRATEWESNISKTRAGHGIWKQEEDHEKLPVNHGDPGHLSQSLTWALFKAPLAFWEKSSGPGPEATRFCPFRTTPWS